MVNMIGDVKVAADARAGSAEGAVLPLSAGTVAASGRGVIVFARPRTVGAEIGRASCRERV